jgi:hypothetical protein
MNPSEQYRADIEQQLEDFLATIPRGVDRRVLGQPLYEAYQRFAAGQNFWPISLAAFGRAMGKRFPRYATSSGRYYVGIGLDEDR